VNNHTKEIIHKGEKDWIHSEDYSTSLSYEQTVDYWKKLLTKYSEEGEQINIKICKSFCESLDEMIDLFANYNKLEFRSMSVLAAVDHNNDLWFIKLIDIAYISELDPELERDEGVLTGLKSIKQIIEEIMGEME
jgi:hypothetical protein